MNVSIDKEVLMDLGSTQSNSDDFNELLGLVPYWCSISTIQEIDKSTLAKLDHQDKMRFLQLLDKCNNQSPVSRMSDCMVTRNGESELVDKEFGLSEVCE